MAKVCFSMHETALSLLNRLRHSPEHEGWNRLAELYTPLIRAWLRRYDVQDSDADDLIQEVLLAVFKDLIAFQHGGQPGAFRGWLKAILIKDDANDAWPDDRLSPFFRANCWILTAAQNPVQQSEAQVSNPLSPQPSRGLARPTGK